ncbi:MAG: glycosyl hydrolase [Candidatus Neomarinimicrobiota bacterium]|nr:MAG: glycosyl hydrolase [Candidatus Neomarinimicrobiota bacterium]
MKSSILFMALLILVSCSSTNEWEVLFDGKTVQGLRGYRQTDFPSKDWVVVDGTLKTIPGHGVDLISENIYKDFELELEWKVSTGGNSGIFYYATEEGDYIWQSAPEMQVLDNDTHTDGKNTLSSAGALYDLIMPSNVTLKPVGEFNKVRIKAKDNKIEHWVNGNKVLEYNYGSDEMWDLVAKRNLIQCPLFAKSDEGHIGFQGDHGEIGIAILKLENYKLYET